MRTMLDAVHRFARDVATASPERVLIVTDNVDENLELSSRNLMHVAVCGVQQADPVSLVGFPQVLVTRAALAKFEEVFA